MKARIFHTVNCGLYFWQDGAGILFDGLHGRGPFQCFSPLPGAIWRQLLHGQGLFAHLDGALFSHAHGDHCDPDLLYFVQHASSPLPCFLYGGAGNTISAVPAVPGAIRMEVGRFTIYAISAVHNGIDPKHQALFQLPNCVFLLESGEERFLIGGDGALCGISGAALELCSRADLAFLNPCHLDEAENVQTLRSIEPKRIALYHLPFREDDRYQYHGMAARLIRQPPEGLATPFLLPHMSWLQEEAPPWAGRAQSLHGERCI